MDSIIQLIKTLRGKNGCPWDQRQQPKDILNYLIEEVYELKEAIISEDTVSIKEELGDVLFQIVFLLRLFEEKEELTVNQVMEGITAKMIRRHPHVFGNESLTTEAEVLQRWRSIKQGEKGENDKSILDSIPLTLPALMLAYRISERAGGVGFDWQDINGVMAKVEEEWAELKSDLRQAQDSVNFLPNASLELGDVLFSLVNLARFARIHPETALTESVRKFEKRFRYMEQQVRSTGSSLESFFKNADAMDRLWEKAKHETD